MVAYLVYGVVDDAQEINSRKGDDSFVIVRQNTNVGLLVVPYLVNKVF